MRRNAGSLWCSPAHRRRRTFRTDGLADVVRLALGEIEAYTRVESQSGFLNVSPAIINDLVLMLAMMENATTSRRRTPGRGGATAATPTADRRPRLASPSRGSGGKRPDRQRERLDWRRPRCSACSCRRLAAGTYRRGTPTDAGCGVTVSVDLANHLLEKPTQTVPALDVGRAAQPSGPGLRCRSSPGEPPGRCGHRGGHSDCGAGHLAAVVAFIETERTRRRMDRATRSTPRCWSSTAIDSWGEAVLH